MAERVLPLGRLADLIEIVVALVGKQVLAEFDHGFILIRKACGAGAAAARMASMMGS